MRVLAAIIALAVWSCRLRARALEHDEARSRDHIPRALLTALGIADNGPVHRLLSCGQTLGPSKCLSALSVWRAENAVEALESGREARSNVTADVERFPWEQYNNSSDEQLYSKLCDGAERLLRYRSLSLDIPGYTLQLESRGNGALNVDILKSDEGVTARGSMKKLQKKFYGILPFLMVPGLIMSAILPFVLPALKLMVVGVGILNNMALSGAVFTLLRNNAFNDHYEKKVIYVNDGYKNEKHAPVYDEIPIENVDIHYSDSNVHTIADHGQTAEDHILVEEYPSKEDWINQYYGNSDGALKIKRNSQRKSNRFRTRM